MTLKPQNISFPGAFHNLNFSCSFVFKDSKLDITIGPYETYEDALFGYKVMLNVKLSIPLPFSLYYYLRQTMTNKKFER